MAMLRAKDYSYKALSTKCILLLQYALNELF